MVDYDKDFLCPIFAKVKWKVLFSYCYFFPKNISEPEVNQHVYLKVFPWQWYFMKLLELILLTVNCLLNSQHFLHMLSEHLR